MVKFNSEQFRFEMLALTPFCLNERTITVEDGFTVIRPNDKVQFFCHDCFIPHLFFVTVPLEDPVPKDFQLVQQKAHYANMQLVHLDAKMT